MVIALISQNSGTFERMPVKRLSCVRLMELQCHEKDEGRSESFRTFKKQMISLVTWHPQIRPIIPPPAL